MISSILAVSLAFGASVGESFTIQSVVRSLTLSQSRNLLLSSALLVNAFRVIRIPPVSHIHAVESRCSVSASSWWHVVSIRRVHFSAFAARAIYLFDEPTTSP